jgi:hypothetical protein
MLKLNAPSFNGFIAISMSSDAFGAIVGPACADTDATQLTVPLI